MTSPSGSRSTRRSSAVSPATTPPPDAVAPVADPAAVRDFEDLGEVMGNQCFGCGPDVSNGLRIRRTGHDGTTVHAEFDVLSEHQGAPGLAHGGILTAAMDEILGTSAWMLGGRYVTGRLETDFLTPVPVGALVHLTARCTGVHGRKVYLEGEGRIGGPDGPIAIRAAALFIEVPLEHFTKKR